jgi:hypothetical protein
MTLWFLACVLLGLQQIHEQVSSQVLSTEHNWKLGRWCKVAGCYHTAMLRLSMTLHSCLSPAGAQHSKSMVAFLRLACLHPCQCNLATDPVGQRLTCISTVSTAVAAAALAGLHPPRPEVEQRHV